MCDLENMPPVRILLPTHQRLVDCSEDGCFIQCMRCAQQYCAFASDYQKPVDGLIPCPAYTYYVVKGGDSRCTTLPARVRDEDPFERKDGDVLVVEIVSGEIFVSRFCN